MLEKYFTKSKEYFTLRNYKYETIFHVCAKNNSIESLKRLVGKSVFIQQMLKKDYVGNTAIHVAAKSGSLEVLEFLCTSVTSNFLEIQNDFGFTALDAAQEKFVLLEESLGAKQASEMTKLEREEFMLEREKQENKINKIKEAARYLNRFNSYITEATWNDRFDLPLDMFLEEVADINMRIFMGMAKGNDFKMDDHRIPRTKVRANPDNSNMV